MDLSQKIEISRAKNLNSQLRAFFTYGARQAFIKLKQAFIEALILNHFNPEYYIQIETDTSSYAISEIFSQLTSDNSGQWYLVAFFSRKMISAETQYETYNIELLAIVEVFKIWKHYLKNCKYEVLVLADPNNLQRFIKKKCLSSKQVRWAQKLLKYYFRIDYR